MDFVISFAIVLALAIALAKPLKKVPWVFYVVAIVLSGVYVYCWFNGKLLAMPHFLLVGMRSCLFGAACMAIVMYIGALPDSWWLKKWLAPVRAELSITGAFLCVGHMAAFTSSYISISGITASGKMVAPLIAAFLLTVLLIILTATSFAAVKRVMGGARWKKVQRLAYVFYGVLFFHLLWFAVPRAMHGDAQAMINTGFYIALFVAYFALRAWKARKEAAATKVALA